MGKIVYLMGKSSTGKDTIFKKLLEDTNLGLKKVVPYTTRPIRDGETQGVEYFFTDEQGFEQYKLSGKIIEAREYHTFYGIWRYFTVDDGQFDKENNLIMIGTPEGYTLLQGHFERGKLLPIMIELDDGVRLERALNRERSQEKPKYEEMCRRFLADSEDFSEEKMAKAHIEKTFVNNELDVCLKEIKAYIQENI